MAVMFTYIVQGSPFSPVKIGRTVDIESRMQSLQTGYFEELRLLWSNDGDIELELHERFSRDRIRGEWFRWSVDIDEFIKASNGHCSVWHMVNCYCTNEQREQFNEWISRAQVAAINLRDWVRMVSMIQNREIPKEMEQVMDSLSEVPSLWL